MRTASLLKDTTVPADMMAPEAPVRGAFTPEDLLEFETLIGTKLAVARNELAALLSGLMHADGNGTDDTSPGHFGLDDSSRSAEREDTMRFIRRHQEHIHHLEQALLRIRSGTYGICRATGKPISKERLRAMPHATLSIEAKQAGPLGAGIRS